MSVKWPMVGLVAVLAAAFVGIFALIPDDEPQSRTMLLTAMSAASSAIVLWFVNRKSVETDHKLEQVKTLVNGNMGRVIDKIPDADVRALESRRLAGQMESEEQRSNVIG